jgi:predicted extracellular nuclease
MTNRVWLVALAALSLASLSMAWAPVTNTICEVQEYDSNGFSPFEGMVVSVRGAVTLQPGALIPTYTSFYIEADECGVNVFSFDRLPAPVALGDTVQVAGEVVEYIGASGGATTEIYVTNMANLSIVSVGNPEPLPVDMGIAAMQVEDNEGRLLRTAGLVADTDQDSFIDLTDGSAVLRVTRSNNASVSFAIYSVGNSLRITGILLQHDADAPYLEGYELFPRFQEDIEGYPAAVSPTSWGRVKAVYR